MSTKENDVQHNSDSTFTPPPPVRVGAYQVGILFVYHIVLALFLAYAVYNVWPPQPWPGDRAKAAANANNQNAGSQSPVNNSAANENTRSGTGTEAATNSNTATGNTTTATGTSGRSYTETNEELPPPFYIFRWRFQPTLEIRLLLLVMLAGAIGSYVHATSSFVDYLGNRMLISSWVWWYLLRPFIGMMLALIFYFVFRGGFITAGVNPSGDNAANYINPFGVAALAALVGMFAKVAADKLNEVFTTLFRPAPGQGDAKRGDKLGSSPLPNVTGINPTSVKKGSINVSITIKGSNFTDKSSAKFGTEARTTKFVDATELSMQLQDADTAATGSFDITVVNPAPGGGTSKPIQLKVEE